MPNMCSVPNCNSNYRGTKEKVPSFSYPKDPVLKSKWLKNVPRNDYEPSKYAVVCERHFDPSDIIRFDSVKRNDGTILTCERQRLKLKDDAVPIIFPGCPEHLNKKPDKKGTNLDKQEERLLKMAIEESKISHEKFQKENIFDSFENLVEILKNKINFYEEQNWQIIISESYIIFAFVIDKPIPKIKASLKINKQLLVTAYNDNNLIRLSSLKNILCMNSIMQLDNCLNELKTVLHTQNVNDTLQSLINGVCDTLRFIMQEELISDDKIKKITFLLEQLELLTQKKST